MKPYSQDLRERIIRAVAAREGSQAAIAQRFEVSRSFVEKLWQRWRDTGRCAALPHAGGRQRSLRAAEALTDCGPDARRAIGHPVRAGRAEEGHSCQSQDDVLRDPAVTAAAEKKSLYASERDTPRVSRLRKAFRRRMARLSRQRLKFLDETGVTVSLTPLYGRATPGVRVVDRVPRDRGRHLSLLAVMSPGGLSAPMTITGAVDADVFRIYIRQVLGPTLTPGDIVVMDNLAVHKAAGIAEAITARGARVEYLPPYSPDFNPIEHCWSKLKTALRQRKARTRRILERAPSLNSSPRSLRATHGPGFAIVGTPYTEG